jgi:antirestriction protein ArdC
MSASFLCGQAGIENSTLENSAAYIANWLQRLKDDRKLVVQAASAANKAADWILGRLPSGKVESAVPGRVNVLELVQ